MEVIKSLFGSRDPLLLILAVEIECRMQKNQNIIKDSCSGDIFILFLHLFFCCVKTIRFISDSSTHPYASIFSILTGLGSCPCFSFRDSMFTQASKWPPAFCLKGFPATTQPSDKEVRCVSVKRRSCDLKNKDISVCGYNRYRVCRYLLSGREVLLTGEGILIRGQHSGVKSWRSIVLPSDRLSPV